MLEFLKSPKIYQNPNPIVPLAAVVEFGASQPVETLLTVGDGRDSWELCYGPDKDPAAGLPVT